MLISEKILCTDEAVLVKELTLSSAINKHHIGYQKVLFFKPPNEHCIPTEKNMLPMVDNRENIRLTSAEKIAAATKQIKHKKGARHDEQTWQT